MYSNYIIYWGHFLSKYYIKVFSNNDVTNLFIVKDALDLKILSILENEKSSISDILRITGKSKPSIFNHLKKLKDWGIVGVTVDDDDRRKRLFFLKEKPILELSDGEFNYLSDEYYNHFMKNRSKLSKTDIQMSFFQSIFVSLDNAGLNLYNFLFYLGKRWGFKLFETFYDEDFNMFVENIISFLEEVTDGTFVLNFNDGKYKLIYYNDLLKSYGTQEYSPYCLILKGVFTAFFSSFYELDVVIDEVTCCARGDKYCTFLINVCDDEN